MPFTTLALKNLVFEDKTCKFTKHTPEEKLKKQSGPGAPPPPLAGILEASPPRNGEKPLELFLPARTHLCWLPPSRRERITWQRGGVELQQGQGETSVTEVEKQLPCRL
jgi:hypothetical protein